MPKLIIEGGQPLKGEIRVSGAKNFALKAMAAAILFDGEITVSNVPDIEDVRQLSEIMKDIGVRIDKKGSRYRISADRISKVRLSPSLVPKLRASIMLVGPMLARKGEVIMPHPGGCALGKRPIDLFIDGFKAMGAKVEERPGGYHFKAKKLKGAKFVFPKVSVTATETLMMTATLAEGETTLINAACEPEISALADYLNACGAKISGAGTPVIAVSGVKKLLASGPFEVIPDRIEAGSFIIMAAAARGDVTVSRCNPNHLEVPLLLLEKMGVRFRRGKDFVRVMPYRGRLKAIDVTTHEYPGFATDLQAPLTVLLTQACGTSLVYETIFEGRLFYVDMLNRMGANIVLCDPHRIIVSGPTELRAKKVESPDLRAGIAMVIAGLLASGKTEIGNVYQIDRGYENLEKRLRRIGAKIKRTEN